MFFIRQNEVFIFFTRQYPHNKSRITPTPPNISLTIYREMPNRARELKQRNTTFNPLPLCSYKEYRGSARRARGLINRDSNKIKYQTLPLPCPAALRGVVYKIEAEAKGEYISPSSSVFCAAKYRGGVRRTEGLKYSDSNKIKYQSSPPVFLQGI